MKIVRQVLKDWTFGGVLRYQSGGRPSLNNQILQQLGRGLTNNPAVWGGTSTLFNRDPSQPLFASGFDPTPRWC